MPRHQRAPLVPTAAGVLLLSISAAALTTSDPRWWLSCFSRLGAMGDAASVLFNAGMVLAGATIALVALPARAGLRGAHGAGFRAQGSVAVLVPALIAALGLSLILIGLLPLSLSVYAHERAANGALASSAGLLLAHRLHLRGLSRALDRLAGGAVVVLVVGMIGLIAGVLSLTVFEALAFGAVIAWLNGLERHLRRLRPAVPPSFTANSQQFSLSPIWGTRRVGVRVRLTAGEC